MHRIFTLSMLMMVLAAGSGSSQLSRPNEVDPAKLDVRVGRAELDEETGFVHIFGEIRNDTGVWIESTRIDVDLKGMDGNSLLVRSVPTAVAEDLGEQGRLDFVYADRYYVPPGEVTVFSYLRDTKKISGKYASHELHAAAMEIPASEAPKVVVEKTAMHTNAEGRRIVSGIIKNEGALGCLSPKAIVAVYDAGGELYYLEDQRPDDYRGKVLSSDESVAFEIRIWTDEDSTQDEVRFFADCDPRD